jgi:hypothetical protein
MPGNLAERMRLVTIDTHTRMDSAVYFSLGFAAAIAVIIALMESIAFVGNLNQVVSRLAAPAVAVTRSSAIQDSMVSPTNVAHALGPGTPATDSARTPPPPSNAPATGRTDLPTG